MNQKTVGIIALLCSPFLAIDFAIHGGFNNYNSTSLGGLFNLIYMTGWLLSVLALYQMHSNAKKNSESNLPRSNHFFNTRRYKQRMVDY